MGRFDNDILLKTITFKEIQSNKILRKLVNRYLYNGVMVVIKNGKLYLDEDKKIILSKFCDSIQLRQARSVVFL